MRKGILHTVSFAALTLLPTSLIAQASLASPSILSDGRVSFRLIALKATEVTVSGDWPGGDSVAMTKSEDGV